MVLFFDPSSSIVITVKNLLICLSWSRTKYIVSFVILTLNSIGLVSYSSSFYSNFWNDVITLMPYLCKGVQNGKFVVWERFFFSLKESYDSSFSLWSIIKINWHTLEFFLFGQSSYTNLAPNFYSVLLVCYIKANYFLQIKVFSFL